MTELQSREMQLVKNEVLTAVTMKINVFLDVIPCQAVTDASEESAASIFNV
jgi:hypothetical protein